MEQRDEQLTLDLPKYSAEMIDEFAAQLCRYSGVIKCPECDSTLTFRRIGDHMTVCWNCGHHWKR